MLDGPRLRSQWDRYRCTTPQDESPSTAADRSLTIIRFGVAPDSSDPSVVEAEADAVRLRDSIRGTVLPRARVLALGNLWAGGEPGSHFAGSTNGDGAPPMPSGPCFAPDPRPKRGRVGMVHPCLGRCAGLRLRAQSAQVGGVIEPHLRSQSARPGGRFGRRDGSASGAQRVVRLDARAGGTTAIALVGGHQGGKSPSMSVGAIRPRP